MPRIADGRCIWCERELAPNWPGLQSFDWQFQPIDVLRLHPHLQAALLAAPPTGRELEQWERDALVWSDEKYTGTIGEAWTSARRVYSLIGEVRRLRARAIESSMGGNGTATLQAPTMGGSGWTSSPTIPAGLRAPPKRELVEVALHGHTLQNAAGELLPLPNSFLDLVRANVESGSADIHGATALLLLNEIDRLKRATRPRIALPPREAFTMQPVTIEAAKETPLLRQRNAAPFYWTNERPPTTAELDDWKQYAAAALEKSEASNHWSSEAIGRIAGYALSATLEALRLRALVQSMTEAAEAQR